MCKECIITKDEDHPYTEIVTGLGLVNFSVEVHYNSSRDYELRKLSRGREIYAIPENCAIRYDSNTKIFHFFGDIYLFKDGKKEK